MFINWDDAVLHFQPQELGPTSKGIPLPFYGNYGGPLWSAGEVGGTTPQLPQDGDPQSLVPPSLDGLDTAFYFHDLAYQNSPGSTLLPEDDFQLLATIASLQFTDPNAPLYGGDMEASLYAGFASLSYIGLLMSNPEFLAELSGAELSLLPAFTLDAIQNLEAGLAAEPNEGRSIHGALHVFEAKYLPLLEAQFDFVL